MLAVFPIFQKIRFLKVPGLKTVFLKISHHKKQHSILDWALFLVLHTELWRSLRSLRWASLHSGYQNTSLFRSMVFNNGRVYWVPGSSRGIEGRALEIFEHVLPLTGTSVALPSLQAVQRSILISEEIDAKEVLLSL